jgi:pimeloyl-ACP methyl ester carboxylesterase
VHGCLTDLARRADLRFYGADHFVQDLDDVRAVLRHERIDILGISYGTRAAWFAAVAGERLAGLPLLLYSTDAARRLPWLIHQARQGSAPALEDALDDALREGGSQVALGLLLTVQCSEEWTVNRRVAEWPVSASTWELFAAGCRDWPRFSVPQGFRDRFSSSSRALIVSGEWDPTTGPR